MNVLVLAPHADDEVIGCGGAIARHVARGDTVRVLVLTRPSLHANAYVNAQRYGVAVDDAWRTRQAEAQTCAGILGVHYVFAEFPEVAEHAYSKTDMISAIEREVRTLWPQMVYTSHPADVNQDHRLVYECTLIAARPRGTSSSIRRVLAYQSDAYTLPGLVPAANVALLLTPHEIETKMRAFDAYAHEQRASPHSRSRNKLEARVRSIGAKWYAEVAEEFLLVWEIQE